MIVIKISISNMKWLYKMLATDKNTPNTGLFFMYAMTIGILQNNSILVFTSS